MRPIDSENVIAWLNAQIEKVRGGLLHDSGFPTNVIVALTDVKRFVKNLPTIEPEVRHGRWIEPDSETIGKYRDDGCVAYYTCSCCKEISKTDYDFCPNCGARMDATDTNVGGKGGADNG